MKRLLFSMLLLVACSSEPAKPKPFYVLVPTTPISWVQALGPFPNEVLAQSEARKLPSTQWQVVLVTDPKVYEQSP